MIRLKRQNCEILNTFAFFIYGDGVFESGPFGLSDWISTPNNLFMLFRGDNVSPSTTPPNTNTTPVLFYITSTSPSSNTTYVGFNTPVIVTFNNDIDVKSVMSYNISISTATATQTNFPNTSFDITTQGNSISINLNRIMEHNTSYTVSMSPSIRDTSGNSLSYSDPLLRFSFTVKPYNKKTDIGQALTRMIYDDINNVIYGIDKVNKKLLSIDVATNSVLPIYNLTYRPDDLCIDSINNRIFIVNNGSSFISEFDLLQAKITNNRIASRSSIYELTNYNPIAFTPTKKATQMLFVNSGLLYIPKAFKN